MRSRRLRIAVAILLAALLLAFVVVWRALDQEALRQLAESQLARTLGAPVSVSRVEPSYFPRPLVTGSGIVVGNPGDLPPWLRLQRVIVVPDVMSLFSDAIRIRRLELAGLDLAVRRGRAGDWRLPVDLSSLSAAGAGGQQLVLDEIVLSDGVFRLWDERLPPRSRDLAAVTGIAATLGPDGDRRTITRARGTIGSSTLSGGGRFGPDGIVFDVELSSVDDRAVPALFALAGATPPQKLSIAGADPVRLSLRVSPDGMPSVTGKLALSTIAVGTLAATNVRAPLALRGRTLKLDPLTFTAYEGAGHASLSSDVGVTPVTWRLRGAWDNVDVQALLEANTGVRDKLEGKGRAQFDLRGAAGRPLEQVLSGSADITVRDGRIRNFPLLDAINRALRVAETGGDDIVFERLNATIAVSNGRMRTDDLQLLARDMQVSARGEITFDQRLAFQGTAVLSKETTDEIVGRVHEMSRLRTSGLLQVPFTATGTLAAPAFNIDLSTVLQDSTRRELERQIQRQLKRILKP